MRLIRRRMGLMATTVLYAMGGTIAHAEATSTEATSTEVTIVGSRLRTDPQASASPIQVIKGDDATVQGLTSAAEILQSLAVTSGTSQITNAYGNKVVDGGGGVNTLGLRGLGPDRTLILLNGRRVSPAGTRGSVGAVDLNVLPDAMIGRIDILRDGASAIYGSDAVAGVVNIVTRDITGVTLEARTSFPEQGGGEQYRVALLAGKTFGRLKVQGSFEHYEQSALSLGQRAWTSCNAAYMFTATGARADYIDPATGQPKCYPTGVTGEYGVTINTLGTATLAGVPAAGSTGLGFNRWRPNASVTTGLVGFEGIGGVNTQLVRDSFDPRMLNDSLISPDRTNSLYTQATYQMSDAAEIYGDALITQRTSAQTEFRQLSLDYPTGSPLLPANIAAITGNFLPAGGSLLFAGPVKAHAYVGFGNDHTRQDEDYLKVTAGMRGAVPGLSGWRYDGYMMYAKSDANYTFDSFLTDRMSNSVQVSAAVAGVPAALVRNGLTCNVNNTSPSTAACVPAPVLNAQMLGGALPTDWASYIFQPVTGHTRYDEATFAADIKGRVLTLPAGDLDAVFGIEYRRSAINDQPPLDSVNGNTFNITSAAPTVGHDSVIEAYGEFNVPLLKDQPFVKMLNLELAGRYTDYASYGSGSTYKAGLVYTPFDALTLRASQGTSFRAPALFEQFLGGTTGALSGAGDPCNNYDAAGVSPNRKTNCAAEGLPAGFVNNNAIGVLTAGGAAQGLRAETSRNVTMGAVLKGIFLPKAVGDITLSVDYFNVEIRNGVARAGAAYLLAQCYDSSGFRTAGSWCNYSRRDPVTHALGVYDSYTNIAVQTSTGYDYDLSWQRNFGELGIVVDAAVTRFMRQATANFASDPPIDYNGTLNTPRYTGTLDARFSYGRWQVHYGVEAIGAMQSYSLVGIAKGKGYVFDVPDYYVQNLSVAYRTPQWTATVGVRNLANVTPPQISAGAYDRVGEAPLYSGYDYLGRQVFITLSKSF